MHSKYFLRLVRHHDRLNNARILALVKTFFPNWERTKGVCLTRWMEGRRMTFDSLNIRGFIDSYSGWSSLKPRLSLGLAWKYAYALKATIAHLRTRDRREGGEKKVVGKTFLHQSKKNYFSLLHLSSSFVTFFLRGVTDGWDRGDSIRF